MSLVLLIWSRATTERSLADDLRASAFSFARHGGIVRQMKVTDALLLAALPAIATAGNFAECILDKMPGVENDAAAMATYQVCKERFPAGLDGVEQGSGRGWLGYESGAECAAEESRDTRSLKAAGAIRVSCNKLYELPIPLGLFDDIPSR